MKSEPVSLVIFLILQWPNVKHGEYKLTEEIKRTGCANKVVDYLGLIL